MLKLNSLASTIFMILFVSISRKLIISKYRNLIVHSTLGLEPKAPATRSTANEPISSQLVSKLAHSVENTLKDTDLMLKYNRSIVGEICIYEV